MTEQNPFELVKPQPLLIVISGPSGVGKDALIQRMKERNMVFHFVITAATRLPRSGERNGEDYFFYSKNDFEELIKQDELLDYAVVYGEYKGIPKKQVRDALASGMDVVMRMGVQGAITVHNICPEAILIFLTARDEEELVSRLRTRKSETPDQLSLRVATARQGLNSMFEFDYQVVNENNKLDEAVNALEAIVKAEHLRVRQRKISL